jgi:hypothetical protein
MLSRSLRFTTLLAAFIIVWAGAGVGVGVAGADSDNAGGDEYPISIINRPFILPQGAIQAGFYVGADKSFDEVAGALQVDYGLMRRLQVSAGYSLGLNPFDFKGDVFGRAHFLFLTGGKIEGMAVVSGGYSLASEGALPVEVGALFWYTITDSLAVYTVPTLSLALAEEVDDALGATRPIFVSIPIALAVQPIQTVYLEVGTEIASIQVSDSPTRIIGRDYVPLYLEGYFSPSNKIDLGLGVSWDDIVDDAGALNLLALVRMRGGI